MTDVTEKDLDSPPPTADTCVMPRHPSPDRGDSIRPYGWNTTCHLHPENVSRTGIATVTLPGALTLKEARRSLAELEPDLTLTRITYEGPDHP